MKFPMHINVLGTDYTIEKRTYEEDDGLKSSGGYCVYLTPLIVICDLATSPFIENEDKKVLETMEKQILRHELIHAFLNESGVGHASLSTDDTPWSQNEEMVDWIAIQFPKIMEAYKKCGCI